LDLLDKMLEINPKKRISAEEVFIKKNSKKKLKIKALNHPYLEPVRDADDEPTFDGKIDCTFEKDD
jgi:mitogen-activated protein kinase 1/3